MLQVVTGIFPCVDSRCKSTDTEEQRHACCGRRRTRNEASSDSKESPMRWAGSEKSCQRRRLATSKAQGALDKGKCHRWFRSARERGNAHETLTILKGLVHELLYAQDTVLCSYFAQREGDDDPFIVLTETKFSFRCIPVWIGTLLTGLGSKKKHM